MNKKSLRKLYKEKRFELSSKEVESISKTIRLQMVGHFDFSKKLVNVFLPIQRFNEIDLTPLVDEIIKNDGEICLNKADFKTNTITPYLYSETSEIRVNSYGIPEPHQGIIVQNKEIDYVIVPLLAFDNKGFRVGYGKGFYDNFLALCSKECIFIGVNHFNDGSNIDDIGNHDISLDYIITPEKINKF